jgi:hypothetical protein
MLAVKINKNLFPNKIVFKNLLQPLPGGVLRQVQQVEAGVRDGQVVGVGGAL